MKLLLFVLVAFHLFIAFTNLLAFFFVFVNEPWYVSIPIMSLILVMSTSRWWVCPLTTLENYIRRKMGKKQIGGFFNHYLIKPVKRLFELDC